MKPMKLKTKSEMKLKWNVSELWNCFDEIKRMKQTRQWNGG